MGASITYQEKQEQNIFYQEKTDVVEDAVDVAADALADAIDVADALGPILY